ncbi:Nn.00g035990.m01.CDS01 [Neocucurbitaria sp. VM-36]
MAGLIMMHWSSTAASLFTICMVLWTFFLMFDARRRPNRPSLITTFGLLCHAIPSILLLGMTVIAQQHRDPPLLWLITLLVFRYWRTLINIFFWFRYKPAATGEAKVTAADCTIIIPTVGPIGNRVYDEVITAILVNRPSRLIFSTNTDAAAKQVSAALPSILADIKTGVTTYQIQHGLGPSSVTTEILVLNARVSNKRHQVVHAFREVETEILVMVDDTAIWHPKFLKATLPAFGSSKVGFVGTRKWVKRVPRPYDPTVNFITNLWNQYLSGFWNVMGGLYLVRHNFEIRATNAADGGVFCVSGRSSLIRTEIVNNRLFAKSFLNEYILRFGDHFPGWGPVTADDDNFLTRWVVNYGWEVKIQSTQEATMTTVLGIYPLKFPEQCKRWSRTTFRQNPIALFVDRTIWWVWPLTVWTTYFPWLYNAALFWDGLAVYTLTQTALYAESSQRMALLCGLIGFVWLTKLVKTMPWFWAYPLDLLLYFVIPVYPLFAYWHSLLKVYTAFTFWDLAWSGRKLE